MAERLVLDSTVAVRWFLEQLGFEAAREILAASQAGAVELVAPTIMLWETGNVLLGAGRRSGRLSGADVVSALAIVRAACVELLDVEPAGVTLLAEKLGTSFFDAAFAQVSLLRSAPIVTTDLRFAHAVAGSAVSTRLLLPNP